MSLEEVQEAYQNFSRGQLSAISKMSPKTRAMIDRHYKFTMPNYYAAVNPAPAAQGARPAIHKAPPPASGSSGVSEDGTAQDAPKGDTSILGAFTSSLVEAANDIHSSPPKPPETGTAAPQGFAGLRGVGAADDDLSKPKFKVVGDKPRTRLEAFMLKYGIVDPNEAMAMIQDEKHRKHRRHLGDNDDYDDDDSVSSYSRGKKASAAAGHKGKGHHPHDDHDDTQYDHRQGGQQKGIMTAGMIPHVAPAGPSHMG